MGLRREQKKTKKSYITGTFSSVTKSRVVLSDDGSSDAYEFGSEDMSEELWTFLQARKPKDISLKVVLSADGDRLIGLSPLENNWNVKFVDFVRNRDGLGLVFDRAEQPPKGKRTWSIDAHKEFGVVLEVASINPKRRSALEGLQFPIWFWYLFHEDADMDGETNGEAYIYGSGREYKFLTSFLEVSGLDIESDDFIIPFSDNIIHNGLSELFEDLEEKEIFQVQFSGGWLRDITAIAG